MDRETIYLVDDDGRRKERTAQFLAGLAFDVKTLNSLAELISGDAAAGEPGVSVVSLLDIASEKPGLLRRVKKNSPGYVAYRFFPAGGL